MMTCCDMSVFISCTGQSMRPFILETPAFQSYELFFKCSLISFSCFFFAVFFLENFVIQILKLPDYFIIIFLYFIIVFGATFLEIFF